MSAQPSDEPAHLHAVVCGRVQGVNYRAFTQDAARSLDLSGSVRNLPDGRSVEVRAEGSRAALEQLVARLREGPRFARVEAIEITWEAARDQAGDFRIQH